MKHAERDLLRRQGAILTFPEVNIDRSPFGHLILFSPLVIRLNRCLL